MAPVPWRSTSFLCQTDDGSFLVNELSSKSLVRVSGEHGKDRAPILGGLEGPVGLVAGPGGAGLPDGRFCGQVSTVESNGEKTMINFSSDVENAIYKVVKK